MNPTEVTDKISREVGGNWTISNAHGVDLKKCLLNPHAKQLFVNSFDNSEVHLWLVLEENPTEKSGYKIVFDEKTQMFGLATGSWEGPDMYLGPYGTFLEALENM
jgi:hypothetical protein